MNGSSIRYDEKDSRPLFSHYQNLISGRLTGPVAGVQRAVLRAAEGVYRFGVERRNRAYDRDASKSVALSVPVISIGNLTVGGTGKTPMVMSVAQRLVEQGRRPAILSRGYKAVDGNLNEEMRLIQRRVPSVICLADADRVSAGRRAVNEHGADVLLMDDGFQHRRLRRDLDVVLIDALNPFGYGHVLPRGLLREPIDGLNRADVAVITRADLPEAGVVEQLTADLAKRCPGLPVVRCAHQPTGFVDLSGQPMDVSPALLKRAVLFAAIGNPAAFEMTARRFGVQPVGHQWWLDHHSYGSADAATLERLARDHRGSLLLTTEKDAVKLGDLAMDWPVPVAALRIEMKFVGQDAGVFFEPIDRVVAAAARRPASAATREGE